MKYPRFFDSIEPIELKDNLSAFLGTFEGGNVEFRRDLAAKGRKDFQQCRQGHHDKIVEAIRPTNGPASDTAIAIFAIAPYLFAKKQSQARAARCWCRKKSCRDFLPSSRLPAS